MTDIETALRDSLRAHADDLATGPDPWQRVDRAHRRSKVRRRAALAGALAVVLATGVATVNHSPGEQAQPAVQQLDDGTPRGALGRDPAVRQGVMTWLSQAGLADGVDVLYADLRGVNVVVLARLSTGNLYWLSGRAGPGLFLSQRGGPVSGLPTFTYTAADGMQRLLGVVPRGTGVSAWFTTVDTDGKVHQTWQPADVRDGVVDVRLGLPGMGKVVVLRTPAGWSRPYGLGRLQPDGVTPSPLSMGQVSYAFEGAPGSGVDVPTTGVAAVGELLDLIGGTADAVEPRVLYAGRVDGQDVVAVAVTVPGGGRVLRVSGPAWSYTTTIPQGPIGALGWRVPQGDRDLVGWFFDSAATTTVQVDGRERPTATLAGLGLRTVGQGQKVTVVHGQTHLGLGPEARDAGRSPYVPGS